MASVILSYDDALIIIFLLFDKSEDGKVRKKI